MFVDHNVKSGYIWRPFVTDRIARDVEVFFHNKGCSGSHGGGDRSTTFVYAYLINMSTIE